MLKAKHTTEMGLSEKYRGTQMLRCAVNYLVDSEPTEKVRLAEEVYPFVGLMFGVSWKGVEKNIRFALRAAGYTKHPKTTILELVNRCRDGEFED